MRFSIGADTNVLFSGLYFGGTAAPLISAVRFNKIDLFQSEYLRDELFEIIRRKSLSRRVLELFYSLANVHVIRDHSYYSKTEFELAKKLVRDKKDVPVYVFAKKLLSNGKISFFVSGDHDLLQERVRKSLSNKLISLREFKDLLEEQRASGED